MTFSQFEAEFDSGAANANAGIIVLNESIAITDSKVILDFRLTFNIFVIGRKQININSGKKYTILLMAIINTQLKISIYCCLY